MSAGVLIVEDELLIAYHLQDIIEGAGLRVCGVARSADEAIAIAAQERPSFAVMDMRLEGGSSGLDAARVLFERWGVRSIFISANLDERMREASARLQPLGYVGKPFLPNEVLAALEHAVRETAGDGSPR